MVALTDFALTMAIAECDLLGSQLQRMTISPIAFDGSHVHTL